MPSTRVLNKILDMSTRAVKSSIRPVLLVLPLSISRNPKIVVRKIPRFEQRILKDFLYSLSGSLSAVFNDLVV